MIGASEEPAATGLLYQVVALLEVVEELGIGVVGLEV